MNSREVKQLTVAQTLCRKHHRHMVSRGYVIGRGGLGGPLDYSAVYRSRIENSLHP